MCNSRGIVEVYHPVRELGKIGTESVLVDGKCVSSKIDLLGGASGTPHIWTPQRFGTILSGH
jgi:hypothetical protein